MTADKPKPRDLWPPAGTPLDPISMIIILPEWILELCSFLRKIEEKAVPSANVMGENVGILLKHFLQLSWCCLWVKLAVKRGVLPCFISLLSKILKLHILRKVSLKFEFQQGNGEHFHCQVTPPFVDFYFWWRDRGSARIVQKCCLFFTCKVETLAPLSQWPTLRGPSIISPHLFFSSFLSFFRRRLGWPTAVGAGTAICRIGSFPLEVWLCDVQGKAIKNRQGNLVVLYL